MFGASSNPFGQSSNSPFGGSQSLFGQSNNNNAGNNNPFSSPQPFGSSSNVFGAPQQTGSSMFGGTSTGVFGQTQTSPFGGASSSPAFGQQQSSPFGATPTPAFGASPAQASSFGGAASSTSVFGQNPAFGAFGSTPAQTNPFGSTAQPSQSAFGSNMFGNTSSPFGASQPAFGTNTTPAFGSTNTPAFGSTNTSAFGTNTNPAFGGQATSAFGATSASPFGGTSTPAFGAQSTPAFGSTPTPAFGSTGSAFGTTSSNLFGSGGGFGATTSTPAFGQSSSGFGSTTSTPAFGQSSTGFGFSSSTPAFGQSSSTFGSTGFGASSPFGGQSSSFGVQSTTPTLGNNAFGQSTFGAQRGGSRATAYTSTSDTDGSGKLFSISAMPAFKEKNHEELRWEDYQLGDKGGPSPAGGSPFGTSTVQTNPNPATPFGQTSSNPFNTSSSSSLFAPKTSAFPSNTSSSPFSSSSPFNSSSPLSSSSPFSSSTQSSLFTPASSTQAFGQTASAFGQTASPFGQTASPFGQTAQTASSQPFSFSNPATSSTSTFNFPTPSNPQTPFGQTATTPFGQTATTPFGQTATTPFGQTATTPFGQNTSPFGSSLFGSTSGLQSSSLGTTNNQLGNTQPAPAFPNYQTPQPHQASPFGFSNTTSTFGQPQSGNTGFGGVGGMPSLGNFGQSSVPQGYAAVQQPVHATNPFGTLPAMPQISIGRGGTSPSIQYGISSMPVVDKHTPVRVTSMLTPRHLSQRRIRLPARKYNPKNDNPKAFFGDDEETPTTPKGDVVFHPRENPRALVIRPGVQPIKASSEKTTALKSTSTPVHENGILQENGAAKEHPNHSKANQKPNGVHDDHVLEKGNLYTTLSGHIAGEAAIVHEQGAEIETQIPKLRRSDYYTEPKIQELTAKERAEPGFCSHVKDFVVGRHGFGSIKFLGETDVRGLDLDALVQFNNREVTVYGDETKKPPVGQGLNKPAEVTLLNIKCVEKKTQIQYTEGPKVEKYKEMLKKKAEKQGAKFVSYDAKKEAWTFLVDHFSSYNLKDQDEDDVHVSEDCRQDVDSGL